MKNVSSSIIVMAENNAVGLKYVGFRFLKFAYEQQENILEQEVFDFPLSVNIKISEVPQDESYQVIVTVFVQVVRKSIEEIVTEIVTSSIFHATGGGIELTENGKIKFPDFALMTMTSLSISTTRGGILAKRAGSFLENIPLPIVDPKVFVPKIDENPGIDFAPKDHDSDQ